MPIGQQALKAQTLNALLQHVHFENDTMNPVKNDKVGCNGSFSVAVDQTFMLTASQRKKERFFNRYLLTLTIISARIRLNALPQGRSSEYGLFA